jgi:hypothetical protein
LEDNLRRLDNYAYICTYFIFTQIKTQPYGFH